MPQRHTDSRLRSPSFAVWQIAQRAEEAARGADRVRQLVDEIGTRLPGPATTVLHGFVVAADRAAAVAVEARQTAEKEASPHGVTETAGPQVQDVLRALRAQYRVAVDATEAVHAAEHEVRRLISLIEAAETEGDDEESASPPQTESK